MAEGHCTLSIIPVRSEPSGKSTLVNQLLFGDRFEVIEDSPNWIKIKSLHDSYEGWCERNQLELIQPTDTDTDKYEYQKKVIHTITATFLANNNSHNLLYGSTIDYLNDQYLINGISAELSEGIVELPYALNGQNVVAAAKPLIGSPYLWGGRSPFGIDCSGLIQIAFKMVGKQMPRDAWQQAEAEGEFVDLIDQARPGDIAFFDNDEGRIIHTGILTGTGLIIHASGKVRIDTIDHFGIFNREAGKYSHKLRIIKRFS